ncbi:hypothetical protein [Synechococcus sp. CS-1333]|uniref:hypothetical protein n=1 Tax=Synechococcus sp. CS-1333 TaxID=2848638 RepID=UPI00223AD3CD|nr:hypothetical protein [Synechococcus sp. CS-1333]
MSHPGDLRAKSLDLLKDYIRCGGPAERGLGPLYAATNCSILVISSLTVGKLPCLQLRVLRAIHAGKRLQLVYDCWILLELPDGTIRRQVYLPRGVGEPENCYQHRLELARPKCFFRAALCTYAGMLSRLVWQVLPDSLGRVLTDVDVQATDLGLICSWPICWPCGKAAA